MTYLHLSLLLLGGLGSLLQRVKKLLEEGGTLRLLGLSNGLLRCLERWDCQGLVLIE